MTGTCSTCGHVFTGPTYRVVSDVIWQHDEVEHRGMVAITQLPSVTFHQQALDAILSLAITGKRFTIGECRALVTAQPQNPQTDWPKVTREAKDNGWIVQVGYDKSVVPGTNRSAVAVWTGTAEARRHAQRRAA